MSAKPGACQWPWTTAEVLQELALTADLITHHRSPTGDFRAKLVQALIVKIGLLTDLCSTNMNELTKALNVSPLTAEEKEQVQTAIDTKFLEGGEVNSLKLVRHCNTQQTLASPNLYLKHICTQRSCFDRAGSNKQDTPTMQQQYSNNTASLQSKDSRRLGDS